MIKNEIDQLLDKYWEAATTLDEQQLLKDYFLSGEVDQKHMQYKQMFNSLSDSGSISSRLNVVSILTSADTRSQEGKSEIDLLLEEYWAGESSLADEEDLRVYFRSGVVAPEHKALKSYFNHLSREHSKSGVNLDVKKIINENASSVKQEAIVRKLPSRRLRSIAAVGAVLLACGIGYFTLGQLDSSATKYAGKVTILDDAAEQEEALAITREALALLSDKFGKGQASIEKEMEQIDILNIFSN